MSQPYLSLEAELHDLFWNAGDDATEASLMAGFLKEHPGPALEIGCGSGRLLLPLLRAGHSVEGLELSNDMLALCRLHAAETSLSPVLHQGDMSCWRPFRPYASLLAPAFTLQLARDPLHTLRLWHSWLGENGGLYLTIFIPFAELEGDQPEDTWYPDHRATLPDGRTARMETRHQLDRSRQILRREHRYSISGDPRVHHSRQTLHWFEAGEMTALLEDTGFRVTAAFSDFDPACPAADPDDPDFNGILTFHAVRTATGR